MTKSRFALLRHPTMCIAHRGPHFALPIPPPSARPLAKGAPLRVSSAQATATRFNVEALHDE